MKRAILLLSVFFLPMFAHAGTDPLRKASKELVKEMKALKNPRVALLSFPYHNGKTSSGSSILSERMTTYLAEQKGIRVVERNLLRKLLEEQHLSETGVVDVSAAKKIGKVVGVDIIISGTLNDLSNDKTELNMRAIKSDSGEVLAAKRVEVERSWSDPPRSPGEHRSVSLPPEEPEEKPVPNEAIEIGVPAGRGGGYRGGYFGGR